MPTVYERVAALRPAPMQVVELHVRPARTRARSPVAASFDELWAALAKMQPDGRTA